jgi:hypothetical protein
MDHPNHPVDRARARGCGAASKLLPRTPKQAQQEIAFAVTSTGKEMNCVKFSGLAIYKETTPVGSHLPSFCSPQKVRFISSLGRSPGSEGNRSELFSVSASPSPACLELSGISKQFTLSYSGGTAPDLHRLPCYAAWPLKRESKVAFIGEVSQIVRTPKAEFCNVDFMSQLQGFFLISLGLKQE